MKITVVSDTSSLLPNGHRLFSVSDLIEVTFDRQVYPSPYYARFRTGDVFHMDKEDFERVEAAFIKFLGE